MGFMMELGTNMDRQTVMLFIYSIYRLLDSPVHLTCMSLDKLHKEKTRGSILLLDPAVTQNKMFNKMGFFLLEASHTTQRFYARFVFYFCGCNDCG